LDNHEYESAQNTYECLVGVGVHKDIACNGGNAFAALKKFDESNRDWLFGHFAFDLNEGTESISSALPDRIQFPDLFFFVPEIVIELNKCEISIGLFNAKHDDVLDQIRSSSAIGNLTPPPPIQIKQKFSRKEYIATVEELRLHILRGDCYEINFCQEFYSEEARLDPVETYLRLSGISPTPFAAFYKTEDKYLLCASPERYLKKKDKHLLSQPIKGTWIRNRNDIILDTYYKNELFNSKKNRSENVMIVDLVRNDLSKVCDEGTVKVDELYGVYTFPQVHQMISTVSGELDHEKDWIDAIAATFPMGSMTGAPKKKVLELIAKYEKSRRGLFSGALGYVTPAKDFDFNVVIRSILYNQRESYLSYQVGSGITFYSDAENEFEECMLKAEAIQKILENKRSIHEMKM
jgi:para-aminobenzoate synthetase component 1